jgi:hypothetical protein
MLGPMNKRHSLLVIAVPAALLLGSAAVIAASPNPSPKATQTAEPKEAADPTEAPDPADSSTAVKAPKAIEATEPAGAADAGQADTTANADHQFDGQE